LRAHSDNRLNRDHGLTATLKCVISETKVYGDR